MNMELRNISEGETLPWVSEQTCTKPTELLIKPKAHLVVSLWQKLQSLSSLVHENSVEVSRLHGPDFNGFLSPAHDLVGVDVGCRRNRKETGHKTWDRTAMTLRAINTAQDCEKTPPPQLQPEPTRPGTERGKAPACSWHPTPAGGNYCSSF